MLHEDLSNKIAENADELLQFTQQLIQTPSLPGEEKTFQLF